MRVIYDTNVIVSAVLKPGSIPASLVALAIGGHVELCCSPEILEEYTEVLKRPKFGLDRRGVERFLDDLLNSAVMVRPTRRATQALEEADNRFLECAQEAGAAYLVTGNKRHFPFPAFEGTNIVSPAEFISNIIQP
jgi:putative PIN family toxin of toxin-antitoxin system